MLLRLKELGSMRKQFQQSAVAFVIALGLLPVVRPVRADSWHVTVRGGETDLGETPVVVELKEPVPVGLYVMESSSGAGAFAAQVFEDKGGRHLGVVLPHLDAHQTAAYAL